MRIVEHRDGPVGHVDSNSKPYVAIFETCNSNPDVKDDTLRAMKVARCALFSTVDMYLADKKASVVEWRQRPGSDISLTLNYDHTEVKSYCRLSVVETYA